MLNVLIPTDFSSASIKTAKQAVQFLDQEVNIILFHAYQMPFSHQDLVRCQKPPYQHLMTDNFRQLCKQLKDHYPKLINKICFKHIQGNSNSLFRNFIEANQVDMIVCPENYVYRKICSNSLNPVPLFKKSGVPLLQKFSLAQKPLAEKMVVRPEFDLATA